MKTTRKAAPSIGICIAGLMLAACSSIPQRSPQPRVSAPEASAEIVVARRGWHVDVGFAATDLAAPLVALKAGLPGAQFLMFGFGDRRYLLSRDSNVPAMLAALWPGRGLILVTGLAASPEAAFGIAQVIRFAVTPQQARDAEAFIWKSLSIENGAIAPYASGPYQGSIFFGAAPRYWAMHTCNTWAAEVLKAGGLPVRSTGVVFAGQLWSQLAELHSRD